MAPATKAQKAAREKLTNARVDLTQQTADADLESLVLGLKEQLHEALEKNKCLEAELHEKTDFCDHLSVQLDRCQAQCEELQSQLLVAQLKHKDIYHELRMQRQTAKRGIVKRETLEKQIELLRFADETKSVQLTEDSHNSTKAINSLLKANEALGSDLSHSLTTWTAKLAHVKEKLILVNAQLKASHMEIRRLRKSNNHAKLRQEGAVAAAREKVIQEHSVHKLMSKGVFTEETRNIVRLLIKAGCSGNYVNKVIHKILKSAGIQTIGKISRPSVSHIVREGFYAAQIQLGYELQNAESMTFSADGTSHRSINYNSQHVNLKAESYGSESQDKHQATRFLGIRSSRDGSSEESVKDWQELLTDIVDLYGRSPFGKRQGNLLRVVDILIKLAGMHSDHCAKEKKDAHLIEILKADAIDQVLGEKKMLEKTEAELRLLLEAAENQMIKDAGGRMKWDKLSPEIKGEQRVIMLEAIVWELGKEAYELLSTEEKHILKLFIWAGCGCHKDLNSVRGGYAAMALWWSKNGLDGPVLLANRDNAPIIQEHNNQIAHGNTTTLAQERAFEQTARGGIKTTQLAGAIFNHKDDKKGHHDTFRWWWFENVGTQFTFPDTSNTRFQSHCDAAAALLLHLPYFINFMESLRDNKTTSKFNHMEQNLYKALHCAATKTELAVLALYAQVISHPYMLEICASGEKQKNMLDLGPLHHKVYRHMQRIIGDPDFLIGANASFEMGSLDGKKWNNPEVVNVVLQMIPELPHFKELLVAFFIGAAETWKRFISEFAPGGLIDEATVEEKKLAWMPATNDINEGALGSFRVLMQKQPQLTLLGHNALAMYFNNDTEKFIASKFTEKEDFKFLHQLGCESQAEEKNRKKEHVQYQEECRAEKLAKKAKRIQKSDESKARIKGIQLILDKEKIPLLKGQVLKDQLKVYKAAGAPNLQTMKQTTRVDEIRQGMKDAIELYKQGEWKVAQNSEDEDSDSGEEFENLSMRLNDDDSAWSTDDDLN